MTRHVVVCVPGTAMEYNMNPMSRYLGHEIRLSKLCVKNKPWCYCFKTPLWNFVYRSQESINQRHLDQEKPHLHLLLTYNLQFTYSLNKMLLVTRQVHSYGTRSSDLFYLPQCRTNIKKFSISFQGPIFFFNSLSLEIRNASTASFCSKLKAFLFS